MNEGGERGEKGIDGGMGGASFMKKYSKVEF
jgi:hypothetical protein